MYDVLVNIFDFNWQNNKFERKKKTYEIGCD